MNVIAVAMLLVLNIKVGLAVSRLTEPRLLRNGNVPETIALVQLLGLMFDGTPSVYRAETPKVTLVRDVDVPDSVEEPGSSLMGKLLRRPSYRTLPKSEIPVGVKNLYYAETNENGKAVYTKWLYNLHDAAVLLKERFNVDIEI